MSRWCQPYCIKWHNPALSTKIHAWPIHSNC